MKKKEQKVLYILIWLIIFLIIMVFDSSAGLGYIIGSYLYGKLVMRK